MGIHEFFYPKGVAVIGSAAEGKIGYELIKQILEGGYPRVFAVNPKAQGALGIPGYPSVCQVDQLIDLAVIASPAATVPTVLEDCGHAGINSVVIITAGFSEMGNDAGEEELRRIALKYGMRVVGPNCAGVINTHHRLFASLETRPPEGEVAFISQSGALGGAVLSWAEEQGLGFGKFVSYGNRLDLDEIDLLPYLAQDEDTKVAALYIESVADGRLFMQAVQDFTRYKPLVVIKSGRSQAGRRATLSHTGSMAGTDEVYDAALRLCGAIRVNSVEEMFDLCKGFVTLPPVKGRRVAIVTNSGGPGVLAADGAEQVGLQVLEPSPGLRQRLAQFLPSYGALRNPIDLTVEGTEAGYRETLCAMLEEEYDAALALDISTPYLDSVALARGVADAARISEKPVAPCFMAGRVVAKAIKYLKKHGLANFPTGERAMAVLAHMAEYEEYKSCPRAWEDSRCEEKRLPGTDALRALLEPDAMRWLSENGISVPEFGCATTADEAVKVCAEIGYPAAMKVVSPDILHKSDWGGVRLDIRDDEAARRAFDGIQEAARGVDFRGVIIYPMIRSAQEVLLGISNDAQFGPVIVFGMGGIYTEVLKDISLRIAPIDCREAEAMIREIRSYPVLEGLRGQPPCDLDALADTLVRFSWLPFQYPEIAEIDLNPVFLFPKNLTGNSSRGIAKSPFQATDVTIHREPGNFQIETKGLVVGDVRVFRKESKL